MQIDPKFLRLGELLNGRLFTIPEYQRAYSWSRKQREDLFQDIRKLRGSDDKVHFMATMVGLRRGNKRILADQFFQIDIVDGQQRLTTICLLLRSLQKHLADKVPSAIEDAASLQKLLVKGNELSLLLIQTNHDSSHIFVDYLRDGSTAAEVTPATAADQNIVDAIRECEAFVLDWASDGDSHELLYILKNKLSVIFHEIEDEALVYTVFEVLNSRGLDVTWFDKVKASLMAVVFEHGDPGSKTDTIAELHRIWKDIYRVIGTRQSLNKETLRFAATLGATNEPNRPLSEEDAAVELAQQCGTSPRKAVEQSKWMLRVCEAEARLLENHRLRAVTQIVQARLTAVSIILRKYSRVEEQEVLQVWESATFRIYGLGGNDARTGVGDYTRLAWAVLKQKLSADDVKSRLKAIAKGIVSLDAALDGLRNSDVYPGRGEVIRYFLFRYEEHLAKRAGQRLNESQWNRIWADEPAKSVEHIRPQSSKISYVHRLGNLTMLPPGVNSSLKDMPPEDKVDTYDHCGLIDCAKVADTIRANSWSQKSVKEREDALLKWALTAWTI